MTTVSSAASDRGQRLGVSAVVLAGALALSLAGCASSKVDPLEHTSAVADDYRITHPITIDDKIETLDVPVSVDTAHLTKAEKANVAFFAQSFARSGSSVIAVVAPSGSPNQVAAASIAVEIEHTLRDSGINPRAIDYRVYKAAPSERVAPVRVAFSHVAATTAPCGPWPDQVANTEWNRHYEAFGCASQQNLAAMVDNPLDLMYPRGMTPADAARRATVLDKYRSGTVFTSDTSSASGGSVATGVGN